MRASDARKASNFLASFLTSFLFLLSLQRGQQEKGNIVQSFRLFKIVDAHILELDLFCTINVGSIGENADGHAGTGDIGEPGEG